MSTALDPVGPAPEIREPHFLWLLFGCCAAPLVWLGQIMLSYGTTAYACYPGDHPVRPGAAGPLFAMLLAVDMLALIVCGAGALVSWRAWRKLRPGEGRNRFLTLWGLFSSLWFLGAIFFNIIASIMVPICQN